MNPISRSLDLPRCSTFYHVATTDSYRLGSKKIMGEWGTNLQNLRKNIRRIFTADEGYKLGNVDQAGAEAKIVAWLAPKGNYRQLFENNVKPHTYLALQIFRDEWKKHVDSTLVDQACSCKISELKSLEGWKELDKLIRSSDEWPGERRFYYIGKKLAHSSNYGQGVNMFILSILKETLGGIVLNKKAASMYLELFHSLFPEIRVWHMIVQDHVRKYKQLRNLFGYPHAFTGYIGESMFKDAYSFIPQSTVATIMNIAYTNMQTYIEDENRDWHLLANTHDNYMMEFPVEEEDEAMHMMRHFIEQWLTAPNGERFQMKAEGQTGFNWAPWKKDTNEQGMSEYQFN